ncbi:MAG: hypothetical protein KF744_00295 [Taibaiella sp.]|nr:hypothetical protein [Taibaiella sp.]
MSPENRVFSKIKEISARGMQPRPTVTIGQLANELQVSSDSLLPSLTQLKQLRLVSFNDSGASNIRLTLLGSVVNRDK